MEGPKDIAALVRNIRGNDDSSRKLAAFHLQNLVAHDDFAQALVKVNGVPALCSMIVHEKGNTLAYALGSLNGILAKNLGWNQVGIDVAEKAVDLLSSQGVVNVVRNALHLLVLIASRPLGMTEQNGDSAPGSVEGLTVESLKPLLTEHSRLLDDIVEKVTSGDHALSANALRFLNALLQDALATFTESQFMRFVKRLQDLNVFTIIEEMMRSDITADFTEPIAEFQRLYKDVLRTWKSTPVDLTRPMHQDALSIIQRSVYQKRGSLATWEDRKKQKTRKSAGSEAEAPAAVSWSSLGFQNEHDPAPDFDETGLLGLIDLADFAQSHTDFLKKAMLEQAVTPKDRWCPIARVSLTVTDILNAYFGIDQNDDQDDSDPLGQQLLLGRDKLHGTIAHAFFRLWESAGATVAEFDKMEELVRLMVAKLLFEGGGHDSMAEVEDAINRTTLAELRIWQVEELEQVQSLALGHDLSRLRERLHDETMHFVVEQRIQCLLDGAWFPMAFANSDSVEADFIKPAGAVSEGPTWRFVQLSPNRRYLHHVVVHEKTHTPPTIADMAQRINVNDIGSVVAKTTKVAAENTKGRAHKGDSIMTHLTINGSGHAPGQTPNGQGEEKALLELPCGDPALAAEWADGLLMLLDQEPITSETDRLVSAIDDWSLKIRLMNLRQQDLEHRGGDVSIPRPEHEGEYWYDMGES